MTGPRGLLGSTGLGDARAYAAQGIASKARALAYLFVSGPTLALLALLLPHSPETDERGVLATIAIAYAIAAVTWLRAERLPDWTLQAFLAAGSLLIASAIHFSDPDKGAYPFFFIWVALFGAYFFTRRQTAVQILVAAAAYAVVLLLRGVEGADVESWLITIGTLLVAVNLIWALQEHIESLVARLADAARTDPLTGLLNRRGFNELMDVEFERARRGGRPLTVILGDLDHFKRVNDRLGHDAGDRALVRASAVLARRKRRIDTAARIGGEEFALVVPDTDAHAAYVLAERLRSELQRVFAEDEVPLTISFGMATFPTDAANAELLLRAADTALYAAKQLGRDRSVIYSPQLVGSVSEAASRAVGQREASLATVLSLAEALDIRDTGTAEHSQTVGRYARAIASALGLPAARVERVRLAGQLHDVGKIGVPDSILLKPGPLDEAEWAEMRKHPEIGARILANKELDDVRAWVLAHHERPDGSGYPYGLRGAQIPLEAKVLAVADAYEAMTANRVYRSALSHEEAREELKRGAGTQFDERVVDAFLRTEAIAPVNV